MIRTKMTVEEIEKVIGVDYTPDFDNEFSIDINIDAESMQFTIPGTDTVLDTIDMKVSTENNEKINDFIRNCSGNWIDVLEDQGEDGKVEIDRFLDWKSARQFAKESIANGKRTKGSLIVVDSEDDSFSNSERF